MDQNKKRLRFFYRKKIQKKDHSNKSKALIENLFRFDFSQFFYSSRLKSNHPDSFLAGAFQPLKEEPSLLAFYKKNAHLEFVFPVVSKTGEMSFYKPARLKTWRKRSLGFREPDPETAELVDPSCNISLFLIPGLAFDRRGGRLGRGKGFYDRFLSQKRAFKVGVAWSCQIHEEDLPEEKHDIRMDAIVTEKFILIPERSDLLKNVNFK